ncbi:FAD-dependent monooxygenase, partial [Streptomyces sp. NPDC005236]|uniref:FAD-dependent monooxygenase n=1 Tax=Streptomyces sp. NPDC005236 TaxID=3157028 RepID=UPI0033B1E46A
MRYFGIGGSLPVECPVHGWPSRCRAARRQPHGRIHSYDTGDPATGAHRRTITDGVAQRLFLAGDAAHVHSPAGGQGMNTGIQDGHAL